MQNKASEDTTQSPFHSGEKAMHERTGMTEVIEEFGRRAVRPFMPEQHREFFAQLPFMVVGSVDDEGLPWASVVTGKPGFASSPNNTTLRLDTVVSDDDPLFAAMRAGSQLGLLGIELPTRRRNRVNARVRESNDSGFTLLVDQSFGNCPQYIQTRTLTIDTSVECRARQAALPFSSLGGADRQMIESADTFFVSSYIQAKDNPEIEGVDVSHRGGKPGFIKVDGDTLTIPDYTGNFLFNTMGNFLINPKAGLIFIDFDSGDLLMLSGDVEILWEDNPEVQFFSGAERAWRLVVKRGLRITAGFPYPATFGEFSPNTALTGTWSDATQTEAFETERNAWHQYTVSKIDEASEIIKSFYLEPSDTNCVLSFEAGQYLTIRVPAESNRKLTIRTYTVSSAPGLPHYRISVKREQNGLVSRYLHDTLKVGDTIEVCAPRGDFFIDPNETRPAVLMAGGVGVTPIISMATHIANEGIRTRHTRPIVIFHSAQATAQRAFSEDFRELAEQTGGAIRYYSFIDKPLEHELAGVDYYRSGYITPEVIQLLLPLDDYDFYLCGPPPFMQAQYGSLRSLGVRDARIYAEVFGLASLNRRPGSGNTIAEVEEAEHAIITFSISDFEQRWNAGNPTILEVAESHGLTPDYGCRTGACGSCVVKLKTGSIAYRTQPSAECGDDEVLICCAVPAKGSDKIEVEL